MSGKKIMGVLLCLLLLLPALAAAAAEVTAVPVSEIIRFADSNMAGLSRQDATTLVLKLEKAQKRELAEYSKKYYPDAVQKKLQAAYPYPSDWTKYNHVKDKALRQLLEDTAACGFKLDNAEGMFYPLINYRLYQKYKPYVTDAAAAYIDIMTAESDKVALKDGGLKISWGDVLDRAMAQEKFLVEYNASPKAAEVRQLFLNYVSYALYGTNNTRLFSVEHSQFSPAARAQYEAAAAQSANYGQFMQIIGQYLDVLKKNNDTLTAEVELFRRDAEAKLKNAYGADFSGTWKTSNQAFSLKLTQEGDKIQGTHFAMTANAAKIDTMEGVSLTGKLDGNQAVITWQSGRDGTEGTALIEWVSAKEIRWQITSAGQPKYGAKDYLLPAEAVLYRSEE